MENVIIILIIVGILGGAGLYVYKAKKSGKKCIGCPDSGACHAAKNGGCCHCGTQTPENADEN